MEKTFGYLADGGEARLYTIENGRLVAQITDYGASLVTLRVDGTDVCLGCDDVRGYERNGAYLGAVVGRNANRMSGASFLLNGEKVQLPANEGRNNLHSGPDSWGWRLWQVRAHTENSLTLGIFSPDGDQGFPGNAEFSVTYTIENEGLTIRYRGVSDKDTVFNVTNHAYFNLFGQDKPERAMDQELMVPAEAFCPDDAANIPTGEVRAVEGTPFDFRRMASQFCQQGRDLRRHAQSGEWPHHDRHHGPARCAGLRGQFPGEPGQGRRLLRQARRCRSGDPALPRLRQPPRMGPALRQGRGGLGERDQIRLRIR